MTAPFPAAQSLEPRSVSEAARQMEQLARERKRVAFLGGGTELELGAWPERIDAVLRTRGLKQIVEYQPRPRPALARPRHDRRHRRHRSVRSAPGAIRRRA